MVISLSVRPRPYHAELLALEKHVHSTKLTLPYKCSTRTHYRCSGRRRIKIGTYCIASLWGLDRSCVVSFPVKYLVMDLKWQSLQSMMRTWAWHCRNTYSTFSLVSVNYIHWAPVMYCLIIAKLARRIQRTTEDQYAIYNVLNSMEQTEELPTKRTHAPINPKPDFDRSLTSMTALSSI